MMSRLLKRIVHIDEVEVYLKTQTDEYLLEEYALTKISFQEDMRVGRYSERDEKVRELLKTVILRRMAGLEKQSSQDEAR